MKIKKLKLHGFKSFPDKTEIKLDAPITALVGPNGCGKSNVVDAIKWVLGSQSPTSLRGDEMSDVIFKGSASRQPIGFAKAEFVIDNEDGEIPVDYTEVVIGRKLYRSGESVYLLNGEEVRLKDINELLYDTGIGVENYSLIEQGKIGRVLNSSPEERRELLEEAAGISTFQARKQEAQRKLSRVEDDLERVNDLLGELKSDIHSLKTQAGKARKYRGYQDELQEKKLLLQLDTYETLVEEEEELYDRWQEAKEQRSQVQSELSNARKSEQDLTQDLNEIRENVRSLASRRDELEKDLTTAKNDIKRIQERLETINKERSRLSEDELEKLAGRVEELEEDVERVERERAEKREDMEDLQRDLSDLRAKIEEFESGMRELEEEERELKQKRDRVRSDLEERSRERDRVGDRLDRVDENIDRAREDLKNIEREIDEQERERAQVREQMESKEEMIDRRRGDLALLRRTRVRKDEERQNVESKLEALRNRLETAQSEIQYLESLEEKRSGLSDATKAVLDEHDPDSDANRVYGLFGDCIDFTELGHETIQGALEPFLTYVVVENWETARRVARTARSSKGRVGMLVRSAFQRRAPDQNVMWKSIRLRSTAEEARADDQNAGKQGGTNGGRSQPRYDALSHVREAGTFSSAPLARSCSFRELVEGEPAHLRMARELLAAQGFHEPFHLSSGEDGGIPENGSSMNRDGLLTSDRGLMLVRGERRPEESIVDRRQKLDEFRSRRERLAQKVEEREEELERIRTGLDAAEQSMKTCRTKIYEGQVDLNSLEKRASWLDEQLDVNREEKQLLENNLTEYREDREELREKREKLEEVMERLADHAETVTEKVEELEQRKQTARSRLDDLKEDEQDLNIRKAQLEEQIENKSEMIRHKQENLEQTEERIRSIRQRMDELEREHDELISNLEDRRAERVRLGNELEELEEQISGRRERKNEIEERQEKLEARREEIRNTYQEVQERANELKIHLKEAESERKNLEERAEDQLDADLTEAVEEFEGLEEEVDRDRLEDDVRDLENKVNRMNNVNMAALDQLEEKQSRAEDIEEQKDDLETSKQRLQRIIRKMKKESRKQFKNTLEQGKENFNKLFRKLFGGGKATLEAVYDEEEGDEDEEEDADEENGDESDQRKSGSGSSDLLECGIEVYAKPPGKEMTNLSLLSGGERAMTSIALMMALFMLNPSAICILDEADAPLDESNLDLFIGLLNEFTDLTQFLIITHKKKTIAAADQVYGLTMQEDGVSRLVSLDFEKRIPEEYLDREPERSSVTGTFRE